MPRIHRSKYSMNSSCCFAMRNMCGCWCWSARWGRKRNFRHGCPSTGRDNEDPYDKYASLTRRQSNENGSSQSSQTRREHTGETGEDPYEQTGSIDLNKEIDEAERMSLGRLLTESGRHPQNEDGYQTNCHKGRIRGGNSVRRSASFDRVRRSSLLFGKGHCVESEESAVQQELEERLALYQMYGEQLAARRAAVSPTKSQYLADPHEPRLELLRSAVQRRRVTFKETPHVDLVTEGGEPPYQPLTRASIPTRRKQTNYSTRHVAACAVVLIVTLLQSGTEGKEVFGLFGTDSSWSEREDEPSICKDPNTYPDEAGICSSPNMCDLSRGSCSMPGDLSPLPPPPEGWHELHKDVVPVPKEPDVPALISVRPSTTPPPSSTYPSIPFCRSSGNASPSSQSRYSHFLHYYSAIGYLKSVEEVAARELHRFNGQSYLDYTGSGVYQASQIKERCKDLLSNAYGNAHSRNPSADLTDSRLKEARSIVLRFFNAPAEDFSTVFTSGATGALKMVGEDFPWTSSSKFFYLRVNHNSVLGIREYATHKKAEFRALYEQEIEDILTKREQEHKTKGAVLKAEDKLEKPYCLFAFPAKDNFCGKLYPLDWIQRVHKFGLSDDCEWRVLLDAAAYAPSHILDMQKWPADYTAISFYKMIGYPTGLGVLLLSNRDATLLNKVYWGGGSVVAATCDTRWCRKKENPSLRFEDGTVSFLAIAGIKYGFNKLFEIGMHQISLHVASLTLYMATELDSLRHLIGSPVVERYGDKKPNGGVIAFNILKSDGDYVNFGQVEMQSSDVGIHLRTGCFCNPGACQDYLGLTAADIEETSSTRESCSDPDSNQKRKVLGAVRVSVGYLSTFNDVDRFLQFVRQTYVM
eukprot:GHVS01097215.1.p1 GENE.GHVS01097215.1~~GHVS01097215.1.p1  ORF type:complete len:867 (+),score=60.91 GHVS01097215.1:229-2829(+)